ncbi:alpha/beta fold hydrolase [Kribbella sp. NPDC059898]|uniref:alpha/beta fold hydrolase n=1 Tax=Kribbella sp. NPDC059898 TaxID=3346995 RepID=UPI0036460D5A
MRVVVDDVSLYFDVEGCGLTAQGDAMLPRPTLLLLHGGPGADHSLFKPEFSILADVAQVIYLDQRGSGRSDHSKPATWTWTRWADDVAAFCTALDIRAPVLVGSSSGGRVAIECAARHPDLVAGLVLESTLGVPTSLEESLEVFERRGGQAARDAASRYLGGDTSPSAAQAWADHGLPLYAGASDGDMTSRRARALINDDVQAHFRAGGCGPAEISETLATAVTCPTLVLAGEDDPVSPAAAARRLPAILTNTVTQVEVLADVGHGVFRQAPQQAFNAVRTFLHNLPTTPPAAEATAHTRDPQA